MIDFNFENNAPLSTGSVLISEPFLSDNYFSRSVVFLCDHNEEGSFGFVLNKFIDNSISDLLDDFPVSDIKICVGGPVDKSNLFYIHALGNEIPNSTPTSKGLFIGGDFEVLKKLLADHPEKKSQVRFFVGYSGWSKDQLNEEMKQKSWIVLNTVSPAQILDTSSNDFWEESLKSLGGKFELMSRFPKNPSDN